MPIDRDLLGKSIRQVRELRGLSQTALADAAGLQGNSVAMIERGERGISMETLNALARALKVPAACLAMLGTSKIRGEADSSPLVASMQKLILVTMVAQATTEAKEKAEQAKQHDLGKALRAIDEIVAAQSKGPRRRSRPKARTGRK
jgi:transcriptional regulator with XRE-family HTH domain